MRRKSYTRRNSFISYIADFVLFEDIQPSDNFSDKQLWRRSVQVNYTDRNYFLRKYQANDYLFKVRERCEVCLKLTIKTPE